MTAWLQAEGTQHLVRADEVVSLAALPVRAGEDDKEWEATHPAKRIRHARQVRIVAGTRAGEQVLLLTCRGGQAHDALAELLALLPELVRGEEDGVRFVHGPRRFSRELRGGGVWRVVEELPEPDWDPL